MSDQIVREILTSARVGFKQYTGLYTTLGVFSSYALDTYVRCD